MGWHDSFTGSFKATAFIWILVNALVAPPLNRAASYIVRFDLVLVRLSIYYIFQYSIGTEF